MSDIDDLENLGQPCSNLLEIFTICLHTNLCNLRLFFFNHQQMDRYLFHNSINAYCMRLNTHKIWTKISYLISIKMRRYEIKKHNTSTQFQHAFPNTHICFRKVKFFIKIIKISADWKIAISSVYMTCSLWQFSNHYAKHLKSTFREMKKWNGLLLHTIHF